MLVASFKHLGAIACRTGACSPFSPIVGRFVCRKLAREPFSGSVHRTTGRRLGRPVGSTPRLLWSRK